MVWLMSPEVLIIFLLSCQLQIELGDAGHQDRNVLVGFAHFSFVLRVLGLVMVDLTTRLNLDSVNSLFKLTASLHQLRTFESCLLQLLFKVTFDFRELLRLRFAFLLSLVAISPVTFMFNVYYFLLMLV